MNAPEILFAKSDVRGQPEAPVASSDNTERKLAGTPEPPRKKRTAHTTKRVSPEGAQAFARASLPLNGFNGF